MSTKDKAKKITCKHEWRQWLEYWKLPTERREGYRDGGDTRFYCIKCLRETYL